MTGRMTLAQLLTPLLLSFLISEMRKMTCLTELLGGLNELVLRAGTGAHTLAIIIILVKGSLACVSIWNCEKRKINQLNYGISLDHQFSSKGQSNHLSSF